jgi:tetratricopeptide (TPR) repeat protein
MVAEGLLFFGGFVFLQKKYFNQRGATFSIGKKGFAIFLPSALGLLTLVLIILWRSIFTRQFVSTLRNLSGRSTIWKFSWIAFQEKPVLGQGIVSFPIDYTRLANLPPGDFAPTAHNLWLQIGADYGLLGLTFVFVIIVLFVYSGIKRIWQDASTSLKLPFSLAYLAGFVGFLVQNLVDFTLVTPFYAIIFILIMTLAVRYALGWGTWALNRKGYGILGLIVLGCVFFYQLVLGMQLPSFVNSLMNAESTCQYSKQHPDNAIYKFECSQEIAQQMARDFQNDPDVDLWWNHAVAIQQAGYDTNPYWATQGINLAVLYWGKGDRTVALDYMRHTATAFPMYDAAWLNLGWMEEHTGNYVAAFNAYTRTLRINPLTNRSVAAQDSKLFAAAADDLKTWGESEHLWGAWYDDTRHDRAKYDTDYWRGVIALSVGDPQIAIQEFTISLKNGNLNPSIYVLLSYAYDLNGQSEFAFKVAQDSALLHENRIRTLESPVDISIVASILHKNGADEQAYDLFLNAFTKSVTKIVYARYYALVYGRQMLLSDISPWTIRTDLILVDTQDDWTWFAEEADRRGDTELAEAVTFWLNQLPGIANLEK